MSEEDGAPLLGGDGEKPVPCAAAFNRRSLFQIKTVEQVMEEVRQEQQQEQGFVDDEAEKGKPGVDLLEGDGGDQSSAPKKQALKRELKVWDLIGYGVGSTVGAGIYSLVGVASEIAGPAIVFSFLIGSISCILTGLAYSEFATRVPVAGSAYTFAYTSFGELIAFIIGWSLTLEYAISASAVARSWSDYVVKAFEEFNVNIPTWLYSLKLGSADCSFLSVLIIVICSFIMIFGAKESSTFNLVITCLNLSTLLLVICAGSAKVEPDNWVAVNHSFVPYGAGSIFSAAGTLFFSFLGFDMVSCMAEEVKKPQRDLPIGIIGSLIIAAAIYIAVSLVVTGMIPFKELGSSAPLSVAFHARGLSWVAKVVAFGSLAGLTTATFTSILGQSRIFYRMSKDGLIFKLFSQVSAKRHVPIAGTIIIAFITSMIAFFTSLDVLADAISIGTLAAFGTVNAGVVLYRYTCEERPYRALLLLLIFSGLALISSFLFVYKYWIESIVFGGLALIPFVILCFQKQVNIPTTFKTPFVPLVPCLGIAINLYMMAGLKPASWIRVGVWIIFGLCIYFGYGIRYSKLRKIPSSSVN